MSHRAISPLLNPLTWAWILIHECDTPKVDCLTCLIWKSVGFWILLLGTAVVRNFCSLLWLVTCLNLGSQLSLFVEYRQFYEFHSMCWFSFVNGSSLLLLYQKHCSSNSKCLKYHQIGAKTQAKVKNNTRMDPGSVALGSYHPNGSAATHFCDVSLFMLATGCF